MQLFNFIRADLNAHRPKPQGFSLPVPSTSFDPIASTELRFPKSLYLIQPLFGSYELNPVALSAQASVSVPEGLNLDAWIVTPPREVVPAAEELPEKKIKKGKKGKAKEMDGSSLMSGRKRLKQEKNGDLLTPAEPEIETPEEQAERARVRVHLDIVLGFNVDASVLFSAKPSDWRNFEMTHTTSSMIGSPN